PSPLRHSTVHLSSSLFLCPPPATPFPYTTLFRSHLTVGVAGGGASDTLDAHDPTDNVDIERNFALYASPMRYANDGTIEPYLAEDRKSTRLNSSHVWRSYAVFCSKKKT